MATHESCTCGAPIPERAVNGNIWIQVAAEDAADASEARFGGRYERRDFCSARCAFAAPQYVAPKRARAPRQQYVYGDLGQLALFSGQVRRSR